jgi:amino acid adenylation domain-containing protein
MKNVEDIYPLSPLQQGMLFHSLLAPESGVYVNQCSCTLRGDVDPEAFRETWHRVLGRHSILRTAFLWEGLEEPLQAVRQKVKIPWEYHDWSGDGTKAEKIERLTALRNSHRFQPFALGKAPLMRFALVKMEEGVHIFLWTFHHLLLDGWSTPLLLQEVFGLYGALRSGTEPRLPAPRPFRDYIGWLQKQDSTAAEAYWRRTLAGFSAPTPLGIDRPSTAPATGDAYEERGLRVPPETASALQAVASRHKLTVNTLVLGAWSLVLGRYAGEDDVVFGAVVSGRPVDLPGVESIVGLFINTLPARVPLPMQERLIPWLQGVQTRQVELRQYEASSLSQVQKWSDVPPGVPLFESIFVFENYPLGETREGGEGGGGNGSAPGPALSVGDVRATESTGYPLTLSASSGGDITLRITYDRGRFAGEAIGRLLGHLGTVLAAMAADPDRRLSEIPMLTDEERAQLAAWNDTRVAWDLDRCLHERIEEQVDRAPDAVALAFEETSLTYRELDERANRLARHLAALGAGPESRVGVLMERSIELVVALLGILKAGAAYVPLDPEHPMDRLTFQLDNAGVEVVLAQERLAYRIKGTPARVVFLTPEGTPEGTPENLAAGESAERPGVRVHPDHPAYVLYTSGSTGRPKGVVVSHRAIGNRLLWMQDAYRLTGEDRVLQKTPFSFDVSVWEFFWPLLSGARLVVAIPGGHRDNAYMARLIQEQGVTVMHFVPSMLQLFVQEPEAASCRSLRDVMASGEALPAELAQRFHAKLGASLHNLYGPTEAAVDVTFWDLDRGGARGSVPIGRPIANTRIHLLDPAMNEVPVGIAGELYIGGVNLARGYVNRPDLTAERFLPDPLGVEGVEGIEGVEAGGRLYRTGDLARWAEDGAIEFLGRTDHQVKVRGFRIELGEIEAALVEHPQIREAVVVAREREDGHRQLVAYTVPIQADTPADTPAPGSEELRSFLSGRLPDYMVPALWVTLPSLPLSPSGKVDRKALPAPGAPGGGSERAYAAPVGPEEEALAEIWAGVLGVERVGREDNFFSLGGDSMLSIKVLSQARERGLSLSLQQLFLHQNIRALSEAIRGGGAAEPEAPAPRVGPFELISAEDRAKLPEDAEDAYPLAKMQAGMLFHSELHAESSIYHNTNSMHLKAPFNREVMELALRRLAARHPLLRTSFDMSGFSEPLQIVHREVTIPLEVEDLRHLTHPEQEEALERWFESEKHRLFEWKRAPLLRFSVHMRGEDRFQFSWSEHHAIVDGWSVASMTTELTVDYATLVREGPDAPPPAAPVSLYRDFVALEQRVLASEAARRYWLDMLRDGALIELAAGRPSAPPRIVNHDIPVAPDLSERIKEVARLLEVPIKSLLLSIHLRVLNLITGMPDLITGIVANGRLEEPDGDRVFGLFLNTLPLRFRFTGGTWGDLARRTFEIETEMIPFRHYPLAEIQRLSGGRNLFDVAFTFMHFHVMQGVSEAGSEFQGLGSKANIPTNFPLSTYFLQDPMSAAVGLFLDYDAALFDAAEITRIGNYYHRALTALAENPRGRYEDVCLLSDDERHQVLRGWNRPEAVLPEGLLHEAFEAWAERTPGAAAVTFEGETLTYAQLNERANRLAWHLQRLGVTPESRVGVCLERSLDLVVSLYAVLKAGGAYVPLDPTYPADRLAFMLEDARVPVLLSDRAAAAGLPALPASSARLVLLDEHREAWAGESAANPPRLASPDGLAYVIYTSGSTGRPKGAMNTHRAVVNRLEWMQDAYGLGADDCVMQKTPFSFDVSVWEFFWPLRTGARLAVARPEMHKDPAYLVDQIASEGVTTLHFVPPMLRAFLQEPGVERCVSLRRVICSGEALPADLVRLFFDRLPGAGLHNLYGPTEAAIDVTAWACEPDAREATVPIGKPIDNLRIYLLDPALNPTPAGVPGELHIGGVGLARGYHARPDLTAERFVPDPWSAEPGARLYKTGDLARHRPDGAIDFLGRIDHQVKLRGFRIELGEIEAVLREHPAVLDSAVQLREDEPGDPRIVAYVVAAPERDEAAAQDAGELAGDQVGQWRMVFDRTYEAGEAGEAGANDPNLAAEPDFDISGWVSSYTGEPIPADEMRVWVDSTVERILSLAPRRVLEIGCGTGLLLSRIAPTVEAYWGTDVSAVALNRLRSRHGDASGVELLEREASDFEGIPEGSFDVVVLNSVVQYFPGVDYLVRVIEGAARALRPGGFIFIGDVRSLPLHAAFHAAVELERAPALLPIDPIRRRVLNRLVEDGELVLEPAFFSALARQVPGLAGARIALKRGRFHNELSRFRYDAVLVGGVAGEAPAPPLPPEPRRLDWGAPGSDLDAVRRLLAEEKPGALLLAGVPNARVAREAKAVELLWIRNGAPTVGDLHDALARETAAHPAVEPEDVWALAEEHGYTADVSWSAGAPDGRFDALLQRGEAPRNRIAPFPEDSASRPWSELANDPLRGKLRARLVPRLREALAVRLPEYMVPSAFVLLEELPLSPNGKLDRSALPAPEHVRAIARTYVAPRTPVEETLTEIWSDVLKLGRVGIEDNLFEIGGHSLLATQIVVRIREAFDIELPLRMLYASPTVAELAVTVVQRQAERTDAATLERLLAQIEQMPAESPAGE